MSAKFSTALNNYLNVTGDLHDALNNGLIGIWSGPVPDSADDAVDGSSVLLATISNGGDGTKLTMASASSGGVISKTAAENWQGTVLATGTATFFRYYIPADTGATADGSATNIRIQGSVGTDINSDMVLPSTSLVSGNTQQISLFQIG